MAGYLNAYLKQKECCVVYCRWNSVLIMLRSVSNNTVELKALVASTNTSKNLARCLVDVNEALITDIIKVLEPFDLATKLLSADHRPTIHLVVATVYKLSTQLSASPTENEVVKCFKAHLSQQLMKYATITNFHRLATLLDPRMKQNNNLMDPADRQSAVASLRKLVDEAVVCHLVNSELDTEKCTQEELSSEPPMKKAKVRYLFFVLFFGLYFVNLYFFVLTNNTKSVLSMSLLE